MSSATANRKYLVYTEGNIPIKRAAESEVSYPTVCMNALWYRSTLFIIGGVIGQC